MESWSAPVFLRSFLPLVKTAETGRRDERAGIGGGGGVDVCFFPATQVSDAASGGGVLEGASGVESAEDEIGL